MVNSGFKITKLCFTHFQNQHIPHLQVFLVEFGGPKAAAGAAVYHLVDAGSTGFGLVFFGGILIRFFFWEPNSEPHKFLL